MSCGCDFIFLVPFTWFAMHSNFCGNNKTDKEQEQWIIILWNTFSEKYDIGRDFIFAMICKVWTNVPSVCDVSCVLICFMCDAFDDFATFCFVYCYDYSNIFEKSIKTCLDKNSNHWAASELNALKSCSMSWIWQTKWEKALNIQNHFHSYHNPRRMKNYGNYRKHHMTVKYNHYGMNW